MKCNYCGSESSETIAEYARFQKKKVLKCRKCGLVYLEMAADRESVEAFYSSEYRKVPDLPLMTPEEHFNNVVTRHDSEERIRFISSRFDCRGKKVLEIGAASGSLLKELEESGCAEVAGVELGEEYAGFTRRMGFKVYERSLEELGISGEYDCVVSFHTIEHVYDPMAVFQAIKAALKPGGLFLGEVPNQDDWRIRIFDDETTRRFHYDPNHYYYFSPVTLTNYLNKCGFSDISLETVERYNSLANLRRILCGSGNEKIEETLRKHIFPENRKDEVRLPDIDDKSGMMFNIVFGIGVNSELMGNCLRWAAVRG